MKELINAILEYRTERIYVVGSSWAWMGPICRELALQKVPILARMNSFEATMPAGLVSVYFIKEEDAEKLNETGNFLKFYAGRWEL